VLSRSRIAGVRNMFLAKAGKEIPMYQRVQVPVGTVIGETIIIRGKLKGDEDLTIKGRIEADIFSTKSLTVENSGIVKAKIEAKNVHVHGIVVGNITAEEKVEVSPDGKVVGNLKAPRVILRDGACLRGMIDMGPLQAKAGTSLNASQEDPSTTSEHRAAGPRESTPVFDGRDGHRQSAVDQAVLGEQESPESGDPPKEVESLRQFFEKKKT
jgi:cytoskeletal protein CcmA (bactofilin family)